MVKRLVVEGNSRDARKVRGQQLGKLQHLVVQPRTKQRYDKAMKAFFEFLRSNRLRFPSLYSEVDRLASMFIEELWEEGESRYQAQDTLSALQHFEPQLKRRLLQGWRLVKAWQRFEIPSRAPPFTPATPSVLAGWLQQHLPELALAVAVGFKGLLRTGELMQVTNRKIICNEDLVVIHLGQTKMSTRNAGTESTSFRSREISLMLRAWKSVHPPDAFLVNVSPSCFRLWFSRGLEETGLNALPYKPYSLRRGGATQIFLETQSYASVCQHGRWASERTARVYIQDSVALLTELPSSLTKTQREYHTLWSNLLNRLDSSKNAGSKRGRGKE